MKQLKIIIPILLILLIPVKIYLTNNYKIEDDLEKLIKIKKGLVVNDLKVINIKEVNNYLEYKNLKIENIFENIECNEKNNTFICQKDDKIITMGPSMSIIEAYEEYSEKNIDTNDDLALLGKIKESYDKPSFLTSIRQLREEFTLNMFAINYLPYIRSIDLIEGDVKGLLFYENNKVRELYLYKNKKTYKLTFKNIDDKTIINLINSIQIN